MKVIKNKLSSAFLFIPLFILTIQLQNAHSQDIGVGVKTGMNFSTQLNNFIFQSGELNLELSPNFITGYHLGLIYRNRVRNNLRIQAEPQIIKIGASYQDTFLNRGFEFQIESESRLFYIQLPAMLELTTTPPDLEEFPKPWEETTYHVSFGFYGSYLLDATFSGTTTGAPLGVDFEEDFSNDVTSQFNDFDTGVIVGGGVEYGYLNKIGIETRFMLGMLNSANSKKTVFKPNNLAFSVALYYVF